MNTYNSNGGTKCNPDAVAVTKIIAFFENAGEKETGCGETPTDLTVAAESGSAESGKKSYSESMARIVESNLRRMIEV